MHKKNLLTMLSTAAIGAVAALSVPTANLVAAPSAESKSEARKFTNKLYIVRMAELPAAAYDGGIKGYQATKPGKGQKLDPNSPQVVNYKSYLDARHDEVLASVGGGKKVYDYGYVFNGFAATLTEAQAAKLSAAKDVLVVEKAENFELDTSSTPAFLGLDQATGLWNQLGGVDKGGDYGPMAALLKKQVRRLVLFGAAKQTINAALGRLTATVLVDDLAAAVREAASHAQPGDVVLLSPACSSFDQFRNYAERGKQFKNLVQGL